MITKYQHIMLGKLYYPSYVSELPLHAYAIIKVEEDGI